MNEVKSEEAIKNMEEYLKLMKDMYKDNPDKTIKNITDSLINSGILDEDGKIKQDIVNKY